MASKRRGECKNTLSSVSCQKETPRRAHSRENGERQKDPESVGEEGKWM